MTTTTTSIASTTRRMSLNEVLPHYPGISKQAMKVVLDILFERKVTNQHKLKSPLSRRFIYKAHTDGHIHDFIEANPWNDNEDPAEPVVGDGEETEYTDEELAFAELNRHS